MMDNYTVYHLHTEQSLLDSCTNYKDYVDMAVELGQKAIAFTEHGNIFCWVEKKMYCDANGIKYIHGVECYLTERLEPKVRDNYHTILLAKNYEGVKEINRLCYIASQPDHFYYKPRLSFDEFLNISDNVIKISACLASPLNELRKREYQNIEHALFDKIINHYDYFEIQAHDFQEQKEFNDYLMAMSYVYSIPLIAGTDTHSINQYKAECRTMLQYSKNIDFGDEDTFDLTYKSYDELCVMFEQQGLDKEIYIEAINNTNVMADSVEDFELDTSFKYPILYGDDDERVLLETLRRKYLDKVKRGIIDKSKAAEYGRRVKEELAVFHKVGMSGFMLFMSEMVSWCWENGIPVGFCRGSAGGSTVAYIADIIDVDPVVWGTMFSRFCNEHRVEVGDIDVDISPDQRALVYQYIINRFGRENTAYILANGTLQSKGTIDDICRALRHRWEKEHDVLARIEKDKNKYHDSSNGDNKVLSDWWYDQMKLSDKFTKECPYTLKLADDIKKEFEQDEEATRKKYPEVFYYYDGMLGCVISQSQHPAGIIASPINLIDHYGGFINADGQVVLPINMEEVHEINLIKYDILGLQNIQIIRDTCRLANIPYPKSNEINWNDKNVWDDMITSPVGIFQFESDYAFKCLQNFKPTMINHMSLVNAAIRPSGESYRERLFNHEINHNPSEQIDELLKDNNGFLCIAKDSMVATQGGLKPIQDIHVGDKVYTSNGLDVVDKAEMTGHKDVFALKTLYGELQCTDDHQILTQDGYKALKNIAPTDSIAMYVGTESTREYSDNLLRILGWHLGDGSFAKSNAIHFTNRDIDVVNAYKQCIENEWDSLTMTVRNIGTRVNHKDLYRGLVVWSGVAHNYDKPIHHFFNDNGLGHKLSIDKHIPEFVYGLSKESLLTFLGAYTDTDSSVSQTLQYKTSSKRLCDSLVEVIRRIGYCCSVNYNEPYNSYAIAPRGGKELMAELWDYSIKIRKHHPDGVNITRNNRFGEVCVEYVKQWVRRYNISFKKVQKISKVDLYTNKFVRVESVRRIAQQFNIPMPFEDNGHIIFAPIQSIEHYGCQDVYDLTIHTTHNFVANGVVVHNCFQEDVIKFLQDICGLSGSDADNVRRAIGRKQMDRLQAALPEILEGYCNKSDKPRDVAEKEAKTFLQIIEDSSNYMFGYNHSTGYSMIGYTCAMLRYYYPMEFITAFLNNARTDADIERGTKLAKDKGFKIKAPKFGYAQNDYVCDKETQTIYKGLGSIKSMQSIAADIMQQIYERKPKDFLDVLTLCNEVKIDGKRINSKSLDILVDIGFFSEFGHPSALRQVRFAYDKFGKRKTFKKEALRDFEIEIIRAHAEKETEKQFSKVDNEAIVRAWLKATPDMEDNIQELVANQIEHLGYVDVEDYNMPIDMYLVQDAHTDKWKRVWMRLYHLASNQSIEYKCDKKWFDKHKCSKNDLLKVVFRAKEKLKLAGEDEYGRKQWLKTGEYENIISCYEIIKSVN